MTQDFLLGLTLPVLAFLALWSILRVPSNKRKLAAWMWSQATAQEELQQAGEDIRRRQLEYEKKLIESHQSKIESDPAARAGIRR